MKKELPISIILSLLAIALALAPLGWPKMPSPWIEIVRISFWGLIVTIAGIVIVYVILRKKRKRKENILVGLIVMHPV